jgi:hypothetical protein
VEASDEQLVETYAEENWSQHYFAFLALFRIFPVRKYLVLCSFFSTLCEKFNLNRWSL